MRISVITTVLNEASNVHLLLDSLLSQNLKPDEIIVVDGGSTDKTVEIIRDYKKKNKIIRLIKRKSSIAKGRNIAVVKARFNIIVQIDGGCVAKIDWLQRITAPFEEEEVKVVAGFYEMVGETPFQKGLKPYLGTLPRRYDPRVFMPSGRSLAFRKEAWEKVGGYSESLDRAGEDTLFNYEILRKNLKMTRVKEAIVYWEVPLTLSHAFKKFFHYAKGDAQTAVVWHPAQRFSTHSVKILTIYMRYIAGLSLLIASFYAPIAFCVFSILAALYIFWSIWKMRDVVTDLSAQLWIPIIQISSDIAVMSGFMVGLLSHIIGLWDIRKTR